MNSNITSTRGLTHSFGKYTVFRTVHSIYENTNGVASCMVAFTPCDNMMLDLADYELQDVFDTFNYLLKNQFDLFAKSAIYEGNSSPLNISGLVNDVIDIMEKSYDYYKCSIEIAEPIEDIYLEELTGVRNINKTKEIKKVNIQFVSGMVTDEDKIKTKKLEEEYQNKK